jgi:secondary thiamine-phosphate synthase enzyme
MSKWRTFPRKDAGCAIEVTMSKQSTITARDQPVVDVTSVSGPLKVHAETLIVETRERVEIFDLTEQVMALVGRLQVREGLVNVFSMHTTCSVFINEFQSALVSDIRSFLQSVVNREAPWLHNDPAHSDCDRVNADSHLRAIVLGHSLSLQVSGGEVVLGQWQRILMAELDGPRARTLRVVVMGVA